MFLHRCYKSITRIIIKDGIYYHLTANVYNKMLIKKIRESLMYFKKRDENYKSVNSVSEHQSNYKYFSEFVHFYNFHLILRYIILQSILSF